MTTQVQVMKVREARVPIFVTEEGMFQAEIGGKELQAPSLVDLRRKLMATHKRMNIGVDVPFDQLQEVTEKRVPGQSSWNRPARTTPRKWRWTRGHAVSSDPRSEYPVVTYEGAEGRHKLDYADKEAKGSDWIDSSMHSSIIFRAMSGAERDELVKLLTAFDTTKLAIAAFSREHAIVLKDEIDREVSERMDREPESTDD